MTLKTTPTSEMSLLSPCKINLFLHITGKRQDGYHLLQTVFQLLNYGDNMKFSLRNDEQIVLYDNTNIPKQDNLIFKAARLLQMRTFKSKNRSNDKKITPAGVDIYLDKKLPTGGGLGGGSSNAATTLLALNSLWDLQLDIPALAEIGLSLGADVPIFVQGISAWAEGVGEQITPINLPNSWFIIVKPKIFVSTGEIFLSESLTRDSEMRTITAFLESEEIAFRNDCEQVVRARYPEIDNALNVLSSLAGKQGYRNKARLTGTGACIFLQCTSHTEADNLAEQLPTHWEYFVAQGINNSPVHSAL